MALKHGGLSQLADTADPTHYPVKRKREPRRLNPNWAGIAWLEAQALGPTTLHDPDPMGDVPGLYIQRSSGGEQVKTSTTNYVRPMFQIFHPDASSSMRRPVDRPCAACYDFGRSWNCPAHPERKWLGVGRGWERPATPQEPTAPDFTGWADMIDPDTIARQIGSASDYITQARRTFREALTRIEGLSDAHFVLTVDGQTVEGVDSFHIVVEEETPHGDQQ